MQKYTDEQVQDALRDASVEGWQLDAANGEIFKTYTFKDFVDSMQFVNKVADIAEELGHHPDILITYNKVKLSVVTHDAGGLSELDFKLAARTNSL